MQHAGRPIRSASLGGYAELVRALGADPDRLLRGVGLSAAGLQHPETLIPGGAVRELLEATARATGADDFALRLAATRSLADLGAVGLVLCEQPTARQALDMLCRYLRVLNATLVTRVEEVGDTVVVHEELLPDPQLPMRQSMELAVGVMFRTLRELIGPGWRPRQVSFTHRAPADAGPHRAFFGCLVLFNQGFNGLACGARDLQAAREADNPAAARFARDHLDATLRRRTGSLQAACRELVLALLPGGQCTAPQVARRLCMDRRTLHRRLAAEGTGFATLLHEVRADMVVRHLRESDLPLGEIAALLGFATASSFSHWFRGRFGVSGVGWRKGIVGGRLGATAVDVKRVLSGDLTLAND
ncbi:AraC family transcriptional regulator [Pseudorhodoferax sp.]|uniref:AraC family transcriptional regulator n=1 Tax=Pseudorhodoferax sp. TaxID=1993553 RepID=UPI002DD66DE4|nr:AraC family transcriptional regulator [Pseudorhodoferax sp.]